MTSGFSAHLLDSYSTFRPPQAPFGQPVHPNSLVVSGAMTFNSQMHGAFSTYPPFIDPNATMNTSMAMGMNMSMDISEETATRIATLQAKLNKKLGPEYISQRPGPGGGPKLTYAEGWKVINLANEVFGFNGWSSSIVGLTTDYIDFNEESRRYCVGVSAIVRVTLRDGVYHEDVGYGVLENARSKGAALDKCKKEAVTDAVKRALRNFGNLLGNCLYDKNYTQEVVKMKVQPVKFDPESLHRRPEFDTSMQAGPSTSKQQPTPVVPSKSIPNNCAPKLIGQVNPNSSRTPNIIPSNVRPIASNTPVAKAPVQSSTSPVIKKEPIREGPVKSTSLPSNQQPQGPRHQLQRTPVLSSATPAPNPTSKNLASVASGNISFSNLPDNDDELYRLASDDDAFFAAIDLGEGTDLSALADSKTTGDDEFETYMLALEDEGLGGAIDFDEGVRDALGEVSGSGGSGVNVSDTPRTGDHNRMFPSRHGQVLPTNKHRPVNGNSVTNADNGAGVPNARLSGPIGRPVGQQGSESVTTGTFNASHSTNVGRLSTGGFNFPSMNQNQAGQKRSADMISTSSTRIVNSTNAQAVPKNGSATTITTAGSGQRPARPPLAPLDLEANAKRMKT